MPRFSRGGGGGFRIAIGGDTRGLEAAFSRAHVLVSTFTRTAATSGVARLRVFGDAASGLGRQLSTSLTLPLLAAGAAVSKLALDFDSALTKVSTLTGVARTEVDALGESLFDISARTATPVAELADSLLVAVSAGLRGADALSVVEQSAKLTAIGLGDADVITRAITGTLYNYGAAGVDAARASDVLLAAVQQGNFEADAFANVLGRLLPAANALGIPLDSLVANYAELTRATTNANTAQTGLRQLLVSFSKPTAEATTALATIGLTIGEVRQQLQDEGLGPTLQRLSGLLTDAGIDLSKFFGSAEASDAVAALTSEISDVPGVLANIQSAVGETDKQYEAWAQRSEGQLKQSLANVNTAGTQLGETVLPLLAGGAEYLADRIAGLAGWFDRLSEPAQRNVLILAALAAGAPLALLAVGSLTRAVLTMYRAFVLLRQSAVVASLTTSLAGGGGLAAALTGPAGVAVAVGAVIAAFGVGKWLESLGNAGDAADDLTGRVANLRSEVQELEADANDATQALREAFRVQGDAQQAIIDEALDFRSDQAGLIYGEIGPTGDLPLLQALGLTPDNLATVAFAIAQAQGITDDAVNSIGSVGFRLNRQLEDAAQARATQLALTPGNTAVADLVGEQYTDIAADIAAEAGIDAATTQQLIDLALSSTSATVDENVRVLSVVVDAMIGAAERIANERGALLTTISEDVVPALREQVDEAGRLRIDDLYASFNETDQLLPLIDGLADLNDEFKAIGNSASTSAGQVSDLYAELGLTREQIELLGLAEGDLASYTRDATNALNAEANAIARVAQQTVSLRDHLGLNAEVLEEEEALQALVEAEANAALLALGNSLSIDPSSGLLDTYNQATIDAIQTWFASIDRYVQSLGTSGQFTAVESVVGQQLAALTRLEDALPESTYKRLVERLEGIRESGLDPDAEVTLTFDIALTLEQELQEARRHYTSFIADVNSDPIVPTITIMPERARTAWQLFVLGLTADPITGEVTANTDPARKEVGLLTTDINNTYAAVKVNADTKTATERLDAMYARITEIIRLGGSLEGLGGLPPQGGPDSRPLPSDGGGGSRPLTQTPVVVVPPRGNLPDGGIGPPAPRTPTSGLSDAEIAARLRRIGAERDYAQQAADDEAERLRLRRQAESGTETAAQLRAREAEEKAIGDRAKARDADLARLRREVPQLARGGIITQESLVLAAERNRPEVILPLDRLGQFGVANRGGGDVVINVNGDFFGDEAALRDLIVTNLRENNRLNGDRATLTGY